MRLSIILPVLNEAARLPGQLAALSSLDAELIVADGGSHDGSLDMARGAGITVVQSVAGRARQMNAGSAVAHGDVLLFLHADTRLPPSAVQRIHAALADRRRVWGRFDVCIEGRSRMFRVIAGMMNLRSRLSGIATGDQAIFVRRDVFEAVRRFPDQPLMEDIELSRRLLRISRPVCLRDRVLTSGRRWEKRGVWRTVILMWRLRWAYWRGVATDELARRYR